MRADLRCLKVVCHIVALVIVLPASGFSSEPADSSSALLSRAYDLTVNGDLQAAETAYRQMIELDPEQGYPALTRFLHRTGQTTATEELLTSPGFAAQPPLVRARSYVNAQMRREAISTLRSDAGATSGSVYQRTLLLTNQLETLSEKATAAKEIEHALWSPELKDNDRRDLFARLLQISGPDHLAKVLPLMIDSVVSSSSITYSHARSMAVDGLTALSMGPGYADFHAGLEAGSKSSLSRAWLYSLSCIRKGDDVRAYEALSSLSTSTLSVRENTIRLEELARMVALDTPRAIEVYEELLPISDEPNRVRLSLAQQYFKANDYAKAVDLLKEADFKGLEGADYQTALNLYLTSLGAGASMAELVSEFRRLTADLPYSKVRDLAPAPFLRFSPANEEGLVTELEKALSAEATPNLYLLQMGLENHRGSQDGIIEALQKYVDANPTNITAVEELADALSAKAWQLIADNPETSPPLSQLEAVGNAASKALWDVIRIRPYAPDPYTKLISLYNLYEQPEKAREVPRYLADRPNATADEVHLAAFIYATEGYPELSLPLYERALAMRQDTRFRLNYAAALGRTGRVDDAMEIYRDIIKNGVNGKQYHIHEVHLNALRLAQRYGQEAKHVNFLLELLADPNIPERKVFLLEEGQVLSAGNLHEVALKFFYQYREEFPEDRVTATDIIVGTYSDMGDFEKARSILSDEILQTTSAEDLAFLRNNYALTFQLEGNIERAVMEWQKLAEEMPSEQIATRGLLNAARALTQSGRPVQARQFYEKYVAMNTGDVTAEQLAREEIRKLERMQLPASTLVESAILEYGPGAEAEPVQNN